MYHPDVLMPDKLSYIQLPGLILLCALGGLL